MDKITSLMVTCWGMLVIGAFFLFIRNDAIPILLGQKPAFSRESDRYCALSLLLVVASVALFTYVTYYHYSATNCGRIDALEARNLCYQDAVSEQEQRDLFNFLAALFLLVSLLPALTAMMHYIFEVGARVRSRYQK